MNRSIAELKGLLTDEELISVAEMIKHSGNLVATRHLEIQHDFTLNEARELTQHIAEFLATWKRS